MAGLNASLFASPESGLIWIDMIDRPGRTLSPGAVRCDPGAIRNIVLIDAE